MTGEAFRRERRKWTTATMIATYYYPVFQRGATPFVDYRLMAAWRQNERQNERQYVRMTGKRPA